jgi:hypothetical protein
LVLIRGATWCAPFGVRLCRVQWDEWCEMRWLSYINCFFCDRDAAFVGRGRMLSLFTASPAQFTQLNSYLNVICEKISYNRIFAENHFFFKKVHQKKLCALPV